jgi:hypothetical protein
MCRIPLARRPTVPPAQRATTLGNRLWANCHGSRLNARTGAVLTPPVQQNVKSFPVRVVGKAEAIAAALGGSHYAPASLVVSTFNFSANHLFFISRTEYASCAVLVMLDRDTQSVSLVRLHQMPSPHSRPSLLRGRQGERRHTLYLVIESVKLDTKHERSSKVPVPADGAGGRPVG